MKNVTTINKKVLREVRLELEAVLSKFEKKGLKFDVGNMRYNDNSFSVKLEALVAGAQNKYESALEALTEFKVGDIINILGLGEVSIIGYNTRARKMPYNVTTVGGNKAYKLSQSHVDARVSII